MFQQILNHIILDFQTREDILQTSSQSCTQTPKRQWEECSRETGTDAGLLTKTTYVIIASFRRNTHTRTLLTATCKTTAFPFSGLIPKIDIMFIYRLHLYYVLHFTKNSHNLIQVQRSRYYTETALRVIRNEHITLYFGRSSLFQCVSI